MEFGVLYDMRNPAELGHLERRAVPADARAHRADGGARVRHGVAHRAPLHRRRLPAVGADHGGRRRRPDLTGDDRDGGALAPAARPDPGGRGRRRGRHPVRRSPAPRTGARLQARGVRGVRRGSSRAAVAARGGHRDHPRRMGRRVVQPPRPAPQLRRPRGHAQASAAPGTPDLAGRSSAGPRRGERQRSATD